MRLLFRCRRRFTEPLDRHPCFSRELFRERIDRAMSAEYEGQRPRREGLLRPHSAHLSRQYFEPASLADAQSTNGKAAAREVLPVRCRFFRHGRKLYRLGQKVKGKVSRKYRWTEESSCVWCGHGDRDENDNAPDGCALYHLEVLSPRRLRTGDAHVAAGSHRRFRSVAGSRSVRLVHARPLRAHGHPPLSRGCDGCRDHRAACPRRHPSQQRRR